MSTIPEQIVAGWRESAHYWQKHAALVRQMFAPITRAMIDVARPSRGQHVLDVACGTGDAALGFAEVVGATGAVVCTDVAEEMVAAARRELEGRAQAQLSFRCCSGDALPFEADCFDHVVCRLGTMFFPDVPAGLREMLRVTKPRGRWTGAVWAAPAENPFFTVAMEALARALPSPPEPPDAPNGFRFAAPGRLAALLRAAGAGEVEEHSVPFTIAAPVAVDEFVAMRVEISDSFRSKFRQLAPDRQQALVAEIRAAVRPYHADGAMRFPAAVLVVSGVKPRA